MPPSTAATKRFQADEYSHQGIDTRDPDGHQHASRGRERGSQGKGEHDDAIGVDPH